MKLAENGKTIRDNAMESSDRRRQERYSLTAPCEDGYEGGYVGTISTHYVYKCEQDNEFFFHDRNTGVSTTVPDDKVKYIHFDQGATPNSGDAK